MDAVKRINEPCLENAIHQVFKLPWKLEFVDHNPPQLALIDDSEFQSLRSPAGRRFFPELAQEKIAAVLARLVAKPHRAQFERRFLRGPNEPHDPETIATGLTSFRAYLKSMLLWAARHGGIQSLDELAENSNWIAIGESIDLTTAEMDRSPSVPERMEGETIPRLFPRPCHASLRFPPLPIVTETIASPKVALKAVKYVFDTMEWTLERDDSKPYQQWSVNGCYRLKQAKAGRGNGAAEAARSTVVKLLEAIVLRLDTDRVAIALSGNSTSCSEAESRSRIGARQLLRAVFISAAAEEDFGRSVIRKAQEFVYHGSLEERCQRSKTLTPTEAPRPVTSFGKCNHSIVRHQLHHRLEVEHGR